MKKNKSLLISWCVFGVAIASFLISTKICYDSEKSEEFYYHYYFKIDTEKSVVEEKKAEKTEKVRRAEKAGDTAKDIYKNVEEDLETNIEKPKIKQNSKDGSNEILTSESGDMGVEQNLDADSKGSSSVFSINSNVNENELYEKLPCGYVPKISPDGLRICDVYAAAKDNALNKDNNALRIGLVILLDATTDQNYLSNIMRRLEAFENSKVTFVIPHYSKYLAENVQAIIKGGHEFFLQIPTQTSVPSRMQEVVAPFLANMSSEELLSKLHALLASTKYAIGVANTTQTLLTKSTGVMSGIAEELARRGLIFLDLEPSNGVMKKISDTNADFMYVNVLKKFKKGGNIQSIAAVGAEAANDSADLAAGLSTSADFIVSIDDVPEFIENIAAKREERENDSDMRRGGEQQRRRVIFCPISSRIRR